MGELSAEVCAMRVGEGGEGRVGRKEERTSFSSKVNRIRVRLSLNLGLARRGVRK